jgi:heat shock protein HtpX
MIMNQIKTVFLLALLAGLLMAIGYFFGGTTGLTIAFAFAILMNFGMYWFSDKVVLLTYRAKPITKKQAPKIYEIVEEVAEEARMPMPKIYEIPSDNPNAFATGRNKDHAVVAVTNGIMRILTRDELKGVIAHEFSHIKNKDMLIQTIAATIATVISYLATMARFAAIFGGNRDGGDSRGAGDMLSLLVLAVLTPLMAMFIQLAISRSREYLADESAAKIVKNPNNLADALEKLDSAVARHPMMMGSQTTSSLFIVNPFRGMSIMNLLSTHPPIKERVKRLREMRI